MPSWSWWLIATACLYALFVAGLALSGRGSAARAAARFVPDCAVLFARLLRDPEVPRRRKVVLGLLAAYLASPIDLVPDFIPVAGQLDDAVLVVLALRRLVRAGGPDLVTRHWPGPDDSLQVLLRASGGRYS